MTTGVKNALSRGSVHSTCTCGFPLPRYPGRYPKTCPSCGDERKVSEGAIYSANTLADVIEFAEVPAIGETVTTPRGTATVVESDEEEVVFEWEDGEREVIEL
jgi:hypothetical protein